MSRRSFSKLYRWRTKCIEHQADRVSSMYCVGRKEFSEISHRDFSINCSQHCLFYFAMGIRNAYVIDAGSCSSRIRGTICPAVFLHRVRDEVRRDWAKRDETRRNATRRGERETLPDQTDETKRERSAADIRVSSEWEVRCGEILSYDVDSRPLNLTLLSQYTGCLQTSRSWRL